MRSSPTRRSSRPTTSRSRRPTTPACPGSRTSGRPCGECDMTATDTTDELAPVVRRLLDRQEIVDLLLRYASTIDAKDHVTLRSLFTDDVRGQYGEATVIQGADELLQWIDDTTRTATWQHHMLHVYHVHFVSDTEATTLTYQDRKSTRLNSSH